MRILVSYDIVYKNDQDVKGALTEKWFDDKWKDRDSMAHDLPQSTLFSDKFSTALHAKKEFYEIINKLNEGRAESEKLEVTCFVVVQCADIYP